MQAFIHISKTGGTTLLTLLRSSYGIAHCDIEPWAGKKKSVFDAADSKRLRRIYPWIKSINGHHVKPYSDLDNDQTIQYYVMLRDPIRRCISEYQYQTTQRGKDWSFEQYIRSNPGSNQQTKYLCGEPNAEKAIEMIERKGIVCGMLERYDESLLMFNKLVFHGTLNCNYTQQKVARKNQVRAQLQTDEGKLTLIEDNNKEDIKLFNHVHSVTFPRQVKQYGPTLSDDLEKHKHHHDSANFNKINIFLNRLYRNIAYKPSLALYRLWH